MTETPAVGFDEYEQIWGRRGSAPRPVDTVRVEGPQAGTFLQGQLSQDVEAMGVGDARWSFVLQPTGKVDAWVQVHRVGEEAFELDVDPGFGDAVSARLGRFKLRTKAEITVAPAPAPAPASEASGSGSGSYDAWRAAHGWPAMGAELTAEVIPGEVGQWAIDGSVSFTKGCFTGQELVARIDSRGGNVPRHLRVVALDGGVAPAVGASVTREGREVGTVTTGTVGGDGGAVALAYLHRSVDVDTDADVAVGGVPARILR